MSGPKFIRKYHGVERYLWAANVDNNQEGARRRGAKQQEKIEVDRKGSEERKFDRIRDMDEEKEEQKKSMYRRALQLVPFSAHNTCMVTRRTHTGMISVLNFFFL